jgi:hypothetical protein
MIRSYGSRPIPLPWNYAAITPRAVASRPYSDLMARLEPEFAQDIFEVHFGGALADHERFGDVAVTKEDR